MAVPGIPQNFIVQSANQQILTSWDLSAGATSYIVQRSADNITFATLATVSGTPLATSYLDTSAVLGTQYWYKVAASSFELALASDTGVAYYSDGSSWLPIASPTSTTGITSYANLAAFPSASGDAYLGKGNSSYTIAQSAVPVPTGEKCLSQIRLEAQQRADRVNSQFVTKAEWNSYINQAMFELYDLLVTTYEDYFIATPVQFAVDGSTYLYALPNGSNTFQNGITGVTFTPSAFYKLVGVDLALSTANNAWVTVNRFNFADRNRYVYPNSGSTIYGVFNLQYRVMGSNIEFIPTPAGGQLVRLWYIPRLTELLQDTDTTTQGISGWIEYVIVRAAKYALDKEESDTSKLDDQILFLKKRIEETAMNRDAGMPDKIADTRQGPYGSSWGGPNGSSGGW